MKYDDVASKPETVTLRDQFAMAALPAVIAALVHQREATTATQSSIAYQFADAMMEARKTPGASTPSEHQKEIA